MAVKEHPCRFRSVCQSHVSLRGSQTLRPLIAVSLLITSLAFQYPHRPSMRFGRSSLSLAAYHSSLILCSCLESQRTASTSAEKVAVLCSLEFTSSVVMDGMQHDDTFLTSIAA